MKLSNINQKNNYGSIERRENDLNSHNFTSFYMQNKRLSELDRNISSALHVSSLIFPPPSEKCYWFSWH